MNPKELEDTLPQPDDQVAARWMARTREFLAVPSVVGFEKCFLKFLRDRFQELNFTCELRDRYLWARHPRPQHPFLLSVHVDRHGLVTTGSGDLEYAAFFWRAAKYQEFPSASLQRLEKIRQRFVGEEVLVYDPLTGNTLDSALITDAYVSTERENLLLRVPQFSSLPPNLPVAYAPRCDKSPEGFSGQLDNVISAALVYELARQGFQGSLLFTCEEEIGRSWQSIQTVLERGGSDQVHLLVIDTSPFETGNTRDLETVVLRNRDAHGLFDPFLSDCLARQAAGVQVPVIFKDRWLEEQPREQPLVAYGSTELGRLVKETQGRWNGATIQVPTLDYHTNRETVRTEALENVWKVLCMFLNHPPRVESLST